MKATHSSSAIYRELAKSIDEGTFHYSQYEDSYFLQYDGSYQVIADKLTDFHHADDIQSAVSLAFLDEQNDAHYMFYKQPPRTLPDFEQPEVSKDDVVQFGSYYVLNPHIRPQVKSFPPFSSFTVSMQFIIVW